MRITQVHVQIKLPAIGNTQLCDLKNKSLYGVIIVDIFCSHYRYICSTPPRAILLLPVQHNSQKIKFFIVSNGLVGLSLAIILCNYFTHSSNRINHNQTPEN